MSLHLAIFLSLFVIMIILGAPVYLCMLIPSLYYVFSTGYISDMAVMQKMFVSLDNFVLLAVPMFMMAGLIMNNGGITNRIFNFCRRLLGHLPGGLAYVNVAASLIFSGMSGSALADVGGLGQVEIKAMQEEGYDDEMTYGITIASATMGPIVPPSIPMVIYGCTASVSVGALFAGGFIPGLIIAAVLCIRIAVIAQSKKYPTHPRACGKDVWKSFVSSFLALMMPFVIMGGIWSGIFTPTEAAMVSIVYALVIITCVYREMRLKDLVRIMFETVEGIVPAMTTVFAAALFGWVLQFERLDQVLLNLLLNLSSNPTVILLILNVVLIFLGMILDATPIILLMVPVLLPLTRALGINEVHLGVIVVLNVMIGLATPPIGSSLFMLSGVTKQPFEYIVKCTWRWIIPLIVCLLIITVWPDSVLFLPRMLGIIK